MNIAVAAHKFIIDMYK